MRLLSRLRARPLPETEARKARSIAQLRSEAVPVFDILPPLDGAAQITLRKAPQVAGRAIGAMICAVLGETRDIDLVAELVEQYHADDLFTAAERAFIADPAPDDATCARFVWRYEGVNVLLWACGFGDALPYPAEAVHAPRMGRLLSRLGREGLQVQAKMRPAGDILDAADLAYRYHWAVRNARLNKRHPPSNLDQGVVYERHYAFNWLIGSLGQDWDDITTDT
ncbi:hypothetical protein AQS8620_02727 [Aquimixticola soesokkakensis]|uniref:DUF4272 domain-containing protein n=1 Tax=Aquimixticola soesokkakensis TaxID=1519096 RepID=A0A1Y5TBX4_9RHOB|nr:DUF4272 domain-containing protein [Aquimixticola soesokkakensis]SLN60464.1 hypothetical protein AQS8620_02727 [Aquimixticola soesokkakensis]